MSRRARWTLLFYINSDNNGLQIYALEAFRALAKWGSTPDVHIVAQIDRGAGGDTGGGTWSHARRFHIEQAMPPHRHYALPGFGGPVNMGDGATLADFVHWGMDAYPSDRTALIIWGHGVGYVIIPRLLEETFDLYCRQEAPLNPAPREEIKNPTLLHTTGYDGTADDPLFLREIEDALSGEGIDLIGFDACLMSTVEAAYAQRRVAPIMIASESVESSAGWSYDWIEDLQQEENAGWAVGDVAANIIQVNGQRLPRKGRPSAESGIQSLSAIDVGLMDALASSIDAFVQTAKDIGDDARRAILRARGLCQPFGIDAPIPPPRLIDLIHFCDRLIEDSASGNLVDAARSIRRNANAAVLEYFASDSLKARPLGARGLSIYFPETYNAMIGDGYVDSYLGNVPGTGVRFSEDHRWLEVLLWLFEGQMQSPEL